MDSFSLERVITVGDRKLTDLYESNRDLGIAKEVVLKDFLRKAREVNEFQKQIPLNFTPSKEILDDYLYEDALARSSNENCCNGNIYNELILSIMSAYMYPTTPSASLDYNTYVQTSSSETTTGTVGCSNPPWSSEATTELPYNEAIENDCYNSELVSTPSQTTFTLDPLNYGFEQPSYYNYVTTSTNSEGLESSERCSSNIENISQENSSNSPENSHPFYSELSKALLLNEASSEAQVLVSGDKRKRCYEEADIEAQLLQAKRIATV